MRTFFVLALMLVPTSSFGEQTKAELIIEGTRSTAERTASQGNPRGAMDSYEVEFKIKNTGSKNLIIPVAVWGSFSIKFADKIGKKLKFVERKNHWKNKKPVRRTDEYLIRPGEAVSIGSISFDLVTNRAHAGRKEWPNIASIRGKRVAFQVAYSNPEAVTPQCKRPSKAPRSPEAGMGLAKKDSARTEESTGFLFCKALSARLGTQIP